MPKLRLPHLLSAAACAVLLSLPFHFPRLFFLSYIALLPLFFACEKLSRRDSFLLWYVFGLLFWHSTIFWIIHVTLPGLILLCFYLAVYPALFGLAAIRALPSKTAGVFILPAFWVVLEYLRSRLITGFGWASIGYSQYLFTPGIQAADLAGVLGISYLVVLVNCVFYSFFKKERRSLFLAACAFIIAVWLAYGFIKIYLVGKHAQRYMDVGIIQGNIPEELKYGEEGRRYALTHYISLSEKAAAESPALIVWPEAAFPCIPEESPAEMEMLRGLSRKTGKPVLLGAVTVKADKFYNSALLISENGEEARYDKLHLVPFGEYIPFRDKFPLLERIVPIGDMNPGDTYRIFHAAGASFGVLICFEDAFPELSRAFTQKGAGFLINITNDAWFGRTSASRQHLGCSVLRAVENRVFLLRSANTGISGLIRPDGKIISVLKGQQGQETFFSGYMKVSTGTGSGPSFYTRHGDVFVGLCFLACLGGCALWIKSKLIKKQRDVKCSTS